MGRPRGFDEQAVTAAAATLFAVRRYDGVGVDDLVQHLGVHRNSLCKTFGSKRGLYLAALRWYLQHVLTPLATRPTTDDLTSGPALDLLLMAAIERAPADTEVATVVAEALHLLRQALDPAALDELVGARLRTRALTAPAE